jgi:hypothetical protein
MMVSLNLTFLLLLQVSGVGFGRSRLSGRLLNMKCKKCKWWELSSGREHHGLCQYNPPVVVVLRSGFDASLQPKTVFPETAEDAYCSCWAEVPKEEINYAEG